MAVALLLCPQMEGDGGNVLDERDSFGVLGDVAADEVILAGVAGFDTEMGEGFSGEDRKTIEGALLAGWAENAFTGPLAVAKGTGKGAGKAIGSLAEHGNLGVLAAGRTGWVQGFGIGLQEGDRKEGGLGILEE